MIAVNVPGLAIPVMLFKSILFLFALQQGGAPFFLSLKEARMDKFFQYISIGLNEVSAKNKLVAS